MAETKKTESTEMTVSRGYSELTNMSFLSEAMNDECAGLEFSFDRVKIPSGGMTAFEMAERFPSRIAALLALCPALNYSPEAQARLTELKDIPVTIAQAERDETVPVQVARDAAAALREAGNTGVSLRIYTDAEMEAAGARHGFSETYSFHHVELAVMGDESYFEWLFAQRLP